MIEARDVRMGQWGFSNQVSHHIPYMYDYAGQPAKTQAKVREALRRMYVGSEIGQGYAGDEDNGETSTWYLFSALGFYPLQVGSPYYAIGSPLFKRATVHLPGGKDIVVRAPGNSAKNVYVQSLKVDGKPYGKTYLDHRDLADGATLDFTMGPSPSEWGTGKDDAPPSITPRGEPPRPLRDATGRRRRDEQRARAVRQLLGLARDVRERDAGDPLRLPRRGAPRGRVLHAHLGRERGGRPAQLEARGLRRRADVDDAGPAERARRSPSACRRGRSRSPRRGATRSYRIVVSGSTGRGDDLAGGGRAAGRRAPPAPAGWRRRRRRAGRRRGRAGPPAAGPIVRITRRTLNVDRLRRTRVILRCPRSTATRCRGTLSIKRGRRVVARRAFSVAPDRSRAVTLRVSRAAYRALRASKGRRMRVSVLLVTRGRDGVLRRRRCASDAAARAGRR